jgi:sulfate transport system substrate-binding protein
VVEGLPADVVTLNQVTDILFLQKSGMVAANWRQRLPYQASPSYSLPLFLVRAGNPHHIRDWDDLARPGVRVILANPKTSGNGRYAYLGVYTDALEKNGGDERKAQDTVARVLGNVVVMDTGGRGATTTFVERELGDVLVTFESEVNSIRRERPEAGLQSVVPPMSVQADFPVAVVDKVVDRHGTRELATAYTQFLFAEPAQEILARNFNRVRSAAVAQRYQAQFPPVRLVALEQRFGDWEAIARKHFAEGGVLDRSLAKLR